jgi:hypothetical protein
MAYDSRSLEEKNNVTRKNLVIFPLVRSLKKGMPVVEIK